jgi:hypothetical protein
MARMGVVLNAKLRAKLPLHPRLFPMRLTLFRVVAACLVVGTAAVLPLAAIGAGPPFSAVLTIPPDPNVGSGGAIASNTQLNLFDGGSIGANFRAGASSGTQNIEVNIQGGSVGNQFYAGAGAVVNLRGGNPLGLFAGDADSVTNVEGGAIGPLSTLSGSAILNLRAGSLGSPFDARFNSTVNIFGGEVGSAFTAAGSSVVTIRGGAIGNDFNAVQNSAIQIFGRQFVLASVEISQSMAPHETRVIAARDVALAGVLADGTPFNFDLNAGINFFGEDFFAQTASLSVTLVPEPGSLGLTLFALAFMQRRRHRAAR